MKKLFFNDEDNSAIFGNATSDTVHYSSVANATSANNIIPIAGGKKFVMFGALFRVICNTSTTAFVTITVYDGLTPVGTQKMHSVGTSSTGVTASINFQWNHKFGQEFTTGISWEITVSSGTFTTQRVSAFIEGEFQDV